MCVEPQTYREKHDTSSKVQFQFLLLSWFSFFVRSDSLQINSPSLIETVKLGSSAGFTEHRQMMHVDMFRLTARPLESPVFSFASLLLFCLIHLDATRKAPDEQKHFCVWFPAVFR